MCSIALPQYVAIVCTTLFGASLMAQNLVRNASFESYIKCPERLGNFSTDVQDWSTPTQGSTDYFHGCSTTMGTPKNFNGTQRADFGKGYAGLYLYAPEHYREYLQTQLLSTLKAGVAYRVSFYVSLAERSDFAVKEFGVLFSNHGLDLQVKRNLSKGVLYGKAGNRYHPLEARNPDFYSETRNWVLVEMEFVAKGYERFMLIGNFKDDSRTRMVGIKRNAKHGAYYYIDMVQVIPSTEGDLNNTVIDGETKPVSEEFVLDKAQVFKHVFFDFDEFRLLGDAMQELERLQEYLRDSTSLHVTIHGHTDTVGPPGYNLKLSRKRARAVAEYLMESGIPKKRISWKGHGGKIPVADNKTEAGRMKNRRVEFVIQSKR